MARHAAISPARRRAAAAAGALATAATLTVAGPTATAAAALPGIPTTPADALATIPYLQSMLIADGVAGAAPVLDQVQNLVESVPGASNVVDFSHDAAVLAPEFGADWLRFGVPGLFSGTSEVFGQASPDTGTGISSWTGSLAGPFSGRIEWFTVPNSQVVPGQTKIFAPGTVSVTAPFGFGSATTGVISNGLPVLIYGDHGVALVGPTIGTTTKVLGTKTDVTLNPGTVSFYDGQFTALGPNVTATGDAFGSTGTIEAKTGGFAANGNKAAVVAPSGSLSGDTPVGSGDLDLAGGGLTADQHGVEGSGIGYEATSSVGGTDITSSVTGHGSVTDEPSAHAGIDSIQGIGDDTTENTPNVTLDSDGPSFSTTDSDTDSDTGTGN